MHRLHRSSSGWLVVDLPAPDDHSSHSTHTGRYNNRHKHRVYQHLSSPASRTAAVDAGPFRLDRQRTASVDFFLIDFHPSVRTTITPPLHCREQMQIAKRSHFFVVDHVLRIARSQNIIIDRSFHTIGTSRCMAGNMHGGEHRGGKGIIKHRVPVSDRSILIKTCLTVIGVGVFSWW